MVKNKTIKASKASRNIYIPFRGRPICAMFSPFLHEKSTLPYDLVLGWV